MKLRKLLSMSMLSLFVLGACSPNGDDNSVWNDGTQPVSFTSQIQGLKTRAANNAWDASGNDKIGVFVKQNEAFGDIVNKQYLVSAAGVLTPAGAGDAIYYPSDGSKVDFVAYYPYTATLTGNTYAVDVTSQSSQPAIDLLYSANAVNKDKTVAAPVELMFKHQLTKIVLNISKDATVSTLAGIQVTIKGTKTKGSFALLNGVLTPNDGSVGDIAVNMSADGTSGEAIILPISGLTGGEITFTLNGKTKKWDIPANQNYADGTRYTYPVTIKETGGEISVTFGNATIDDWTSVSGGNIDIDFGEGGGVVDPPVGEVKTIFEETFGTADVGSKPKINDYTGYDNQGTLTFFDRFAGTYQNGDIRITSTTTNHVWLAASTTVDKSAALKISGFSTAGYTNLKLSYKVAANGNIDQNILKVDCGGTMMNVPSFALTQNGGYNAVELDNVPDGITYIEFVSNIDNQAGFRIDDVKLVGTTVVE